jgi:hypothetical protein
MILSILHLLAQSCVAREGVLIPFSLLTVLPSQVNPIPYVRPSKLNNQGATLAVPASSPSIFSNDTWVTATEDAISTNAVTLPPTMSAPHSYNVNTARFTTTVRTTNPTITPKQISR